MNGHRRGPQGKSGSRATREDGRGKGGDSRPRAGRARGPNARSGFKKGQGHRRQGGAPGARKGPRARRPRLPVAVIKQAKTLVAQSGIPFPAALRVVQGKTTLNEVLQSLLREEKIRKLMTAHTINRALATNVALGRTDLEIVLLRRRNNETLHQHYHRSCLEEYRLSGSRIALALHGHKKVMGTVEENGKFTILFRQDPQDDPVEIHKTEIKFAYDPDQFKVVKKFLKIDNKVKAMHLGPLLNPRDRHHFKNLTLQRALDAHEEVQVTTLEGDVLRGHVEWFGRWEFGLKFKGGARATVFRHAVYKLHRVTR